MVGNLDECLRVGIQKFEIGMCSFCDKMFFASGSATVSMVPFFACRLVEDLRIVVTSRIRSVDDAMSSIM